MTSSDGSTSSSASFSTVAAYRKAGLYVDMKPEDVKIVVERTLDFAAEATKTFGSFKLANRLKFKKRGDKLEVRALPTLKRIMKRKSTAQTKICDYSSHECESTHEETLCIQSEASINDHEKHCPGTQCEEYSNGS